MQVKEDRKEYYGLRSTDALVRLHAEALCEGDQSVSLCLENADRMRNDFMRSAFCGK